VFGWHAFSSTALEEESFSDESEHKHSTMQRPAGAKRIRANKAQASQPRSFSPLAQRSPLAYVRMLSFLKLRSVPPILRI
jgi:hypothetical protein